MISAADLADKRSWRCEACGKPSQALERHHCFVHRMRSVPELDDERNLQLVCRDCHREVANGYKNRCEFWQVQLKRYPDLREWWDNLPLLIKERFE